MLGGLAGWAEPGDAQAPRRGDRVTVRAGTALRSTPGGEVIGVSSRDITGTVESAQSTFVRLTVGGHVAADDLRLTADRTRGEVRGAATLRATASASGAAVAELRRGTYVFPERAGTAFPSGRNVTFLAVRRSLWVDVSRLGGRPVAAASRPPAATPPRPEPRNPAPARAAADSPPPARDSAPPAASDPPPARPAEAPAGPTLETRAPSALRTGPGGDVLAQVPGGVPLTTLARENGWVRVRLDGWLPDSAVEAAGTRSAGALTAADLRTDPERTRGRLVRWSVEALAFQTADPLRRGMTPGEPYLLARGPGAERAVLYLAVPDSLVARAQALPPLSEISITARVRNGRSEPAGVPILDLLDLARR